MTLHVENLHELDVAYHKFVFVTQNSDFCPDWLQPLILCECALVNGRHLDELYDGLEDLPPGQKSFVFQHVACGNLFFLYPLSRFTRCPFLSFFFPLYYHCSLTFTVVHFARSRKSSVIFLILIYFLFLSTTFRKRKLIRGIILPLKPLLIRLDTLG